MVSPTGDNRDIEANIRLRTDQKELQKTTKDLQALRRELDATFAPDNAKIEQARRQFERHRKEVEHNARVARDVNDVYRLWGKVLGDIERQNVVKKLTAELAEATKNGKELTPTLERIKAELQAIGATEGEVRQVITGAQQAGGGGSRLRAAARSARVGLPSVQNVAFGLSSEQFVRAVEGIGAVDEALGKLGTTGKLAAGGIGIAIIAITVALADLKRRNDEAKLAAQSALGAQRDYFTLIQTGTKDSLRSGLEQAQQQQEVARKNLEFQRAVLQGLEESVDAGGAFNRVTVEAGVAVNSIIGTQPELVATREAVDAAEKAFAEANSAVDAHTRALNSAEVAANTAAEAERLLAEKRQQQSEATLQFAIQQQLSAATITSIDALQSRADALLREQALIENVLNTAILSEEAHEQYEQRLREIGIALGSLDMVRPQVAQVEALARAEEDRKKAEEDLLNLSQRAIQIQEQGQQRLAALAEQSAKQLEAAEKRVLDSVTKLADFEAAQRDKRTEAESDFMDKELERTRKYRKDLEKLQRDSDRRLLELLQDKEDAQFEATLQNDVGSFLRAERNFERQSEREKNRLDVAEQDRLDAFNEESRRNQQMLTEKIAAIDTETAKKREALLAEIAEQEAALEATKAQIAAKQAAEEAAIKKSLEALVKGFDTSTNAMVTTIEQGFKVLESAGINTFTGIIGHIQSRAQSFYSSSNPASGGGAQSNTPYTPGVTPLVRLTGFADGTLSTRAVFGGRAAIAAVNDHPDPSRDEAIIPYRRSVGLASELQRMGISGGSSKPNVTVYVQGLAPGVTPTDLQRVKDTIITAVMMADHAATTGVAP